MSIIKAFSVFDSKAESYIQPFFFPATGQAIRAFETAAQDENHEFYKHAADYTLFEIGTFNQGTGHLEHGIPINLGNALALVSRPDTVPGALKVAPSAE